MLVFSWISWIYVEQTLAGLLEEGLVVKHYIVPDIAVFQYFLEVADEVLMQPQYTVLVQRMIVLYRQLHQRKQYELD